MREGGRPRRLGTRSSGVEGVEVAAEGGASEP